MNTGSPTHLFWEQHACLPLTSEADALDVLGEKTETMGAYRRVAREVWV